MAKKRGIRKAHNPLKRNTNLVMAGTRNLLVAWCAGHKVNHTFNHSGLSVNVGAHLKRGIQELALPWSALCVVCCRTQLGEQYMQHIVVSAKGHYEHDALLDTFNEHHQKLLKEANPQHIVNAGWVASPSGRDISLDAADTILTKLGCWDYSAPWEADKEDAA